MSLRVVVFLLGVGQPLAGKCSTVALFERSGA